MDPIERLTLTVSAELLPKFFLLLEQGFLVESYAGCSLRDFFCGGLGLDGAYLADKVQTIFLDHNPVDNIDTAMIRENSTVALSAAMPGLAGATLRKGGRFAAMRKQISCQMDTAAASDQRTRVTVKFFNAVAKELGEDFYRKGIWVQGSNIAWFFDKYIQDPRLGIKKAMLEEREIDPRRVAGMQWNEVVRLKVLAEKNKSSGP